MTEVGAQVTGSGEPRSVQVRLELWPVVQLRMPRVVDAEAGREFGRAVDTLVKRQQAFAIVVDNRPTVDMSSVARKEIASWEKSQDATLRTFVRGLAIVMPSRAMFAIAELITWLNPPPYPKKCFLDEREAFEWARAKLAQRG
jgi:hypothetical protein